MVWGIILEEFLPHCRYNVVDLLQTMVPRLIPQRPAGIVNKVQIPRYFLEPLACDSGGDEGVVQLAVTRPIVSDFRKPVDTHDNHESKVRPDLLDSRLPCRVSVGRSETLCRISICLSHDQRQQILIKEQ